MKKLLSSYPNLVHEWHPTKNDDLKPSSVLSFSNKRSALMEDIYVVGYLFGSSLSSPLKITKGIISSWSGLRNNYSNIQIDAALQPGNSGGLIFDERGNVAA
tara:strand:- start:204 stop:509 length:306 start_codon:yes stop_codon:yes gene_type:complete